MTLAQLKQIARAIIPGLKVSVTDDTFLELMLNEGVKDIAAYTVCLKTNKKINVVSGQYEYNLSTVLGDYLAVDKSGLWWNNGTIWRPVNARTLKYFDEYKPNWRSLSNGSPLDYSIDADILTISPPPETTLTEGFWLYYGKKPTPMTNGAHYPFSGTTIEFTHLSIFDYAIVLYAKWKISPVLNKKEDANLSMQEYMNEREEKMNLLYRRLDIAHSSDARLQGPAVR